MVFTTVEISTASEVMDLLLIELLLVAVDDDDDPKPIVV